MTKKLLRSAGNEMRNCRVFVRSSSLHCQIVQPRTTAILLTLVLIHFPSCGQSAKIEQCHTLQPQSLSMEDKLVLSPIIFQGRLISRSNVYNSLYFVSVRVQKVLKGSVPKRMHRHMRLLFHSAAGESVRHTCQPVTFDIHTGTKYVFYVKKVAVGRYAAIATPDVYTKKARKSARQLLCDNCLSQPRVTGLVDSLSVSQGGKFKLKCKVAGSPKPKVTWLKNGRPIRTDIRISIQTKRRRSVLRLSDAQGRDSGKYSCSAANVLGEHRQTTSISVRLSAPDPPASSCPIASFCLNGGKCLYYEMIGELVCRCPEGFAGQRCQFKKARINLPSAAESEACGPYGHDIHLREICAAWKEPPVTEMTRDEYESWLRVEKEVAELKRKKELEEMLKFRQMANRTASNDHDYSFTDDNDSDDYEYANDSY